MMEGRDKQGWREPDLARFSPPGGRDQSRPHVSHHRRPRRTCFVFRTLLTFPGVSFGASSAVFFRWRALHYQNKCSNRGVFNHSWKLEEAWPHQLISGTTCSLQVYQNMEWNLDVTVRKMKILSPVWLRESFWKIRLPDGTMSPTHQVQLRNPRPPQSDQYHYQNKSLQHVWLARRTAPCLKKGEKLVSIAASCSMDAQFSTCAERTAEEPSVWTNTNSVKIWSWSCSFRGLLRLPKYPRSNQSYSHPSPPCDKFKFCSWVRSNQHPNPQSVLWTELTVRTAFCKQPISSVSEHLLTPHLRCCLATEERDESSQLVTQPATSSNDCKENAKVVFALNAVHGNFFVGNQTGWTNLPRTPPPPESPSWFLPIEIQSWVATISQQGICDTRNEISHEGCNERQPMLHRSTTPLWQNRGGTGNICSLTTLAQWSDMRSESQRETASDSIEVWLWFRLFAVVWTPEMHFSILKLLGGKHQTNHTTKRDFFTWPFESKSEIYIQCRASWRKEHSNSSKRMPWWTRHKKKKHSRVTFLEKNSWKTETNVCSTCIRALIFLIFFSDFALLWEVSLKSVH